MMWEHTFIMKTIHFVFRRREEDKVYSPSSSASCVQWNPSIVDTLGTWQSVPCERCPHLINGQIPIEKAYLGHSKISLIQRCPQFRGYPLRRVPL